METHEFIYKVVTATKIPTRFGSFTIDKSAVNYLEYELNKETKPLIGPVFVFKTLKEAMKHGIIHPILKCKYTGILAPLPSTTYSLNFFSIEDFKMAWEKKVFNNPTPFNTHGVDSVTPIEVITKYE